MHLRRMGAFAALGLPGLGLPVLDLAGPIDSSAPPVPACPEAAPSTSVPGGELDTASLPLGDALELRDDGLGNVRFCGDPDAVIAAMDALLGPPDDDTGWVDPFTISTCAGEELRRVTWGALDLFFGDSSPFETGARHFFCYSYGSVDGFDVAPPGLATAEGIGIGTPVEFVVAAYPDVELFPGEDGIEEPVFYVDEHLHGLLTDTGPDGVVTLIIGGEACGV
jgi:hypothetical protein